MTDLTPHQVSKEDTDMHHVTDPGWYAFDDNHRAVLGPFATRDACMKEIKRQSRRISN